MANLLRASSDPLNHPLRAIILEALRDRPGQSFLGLRENVRISAARDRLGSGTLEWHLHVLENSGLVVSIRAGRFRRYFPAGGPWANDLATYALVCAPQASGLARILSGNSGFTIEDLQRTLSEGERRDAAWLRYQLLKLVRQGLVEVQRRGRCNVYVGLPRLALALRSLGYFPGEESLPLKPHPMTVGFADGPPRPVLPPPGAASHFPSSSTVLEVSGP